MGILGYLWAGLPSEKILDFISSASIKPDVIQHGKCFVHPESSLQQVSSISAFKKLLGFFEVFRTFMKQCKSSDDADSLPGDV